MDNWNDDPELYFTIWFGNSYDRNIAEVIQIVLHFHFIGSRLQTVILCICCHPSFCNTP